MINYTFLKRPSPYHFKYANTNQICIFKDDIKIIAQSHAYWDTLYTILA